MTKFDSKSIREQLKKIDDAENIKVTSWEANFLENILFKEKDRELTSAQSKAALKMIDKYKGQLM